MQFLLSSQLVTDFTSLIRSKAASLIDRGIDPQLAVVLVGSHPESLKYIGLKTEAAKSVGIILSLYHLEETVPFEELVETVRYLNEDSDIHGIIIQLPLPPHFTETQVEELLTLVSPAKDVDGLSGAWKELTWKATRFEELVLPKPRFLPPMVTSVLSLLDAYSLPLDKKNIVIVGKGRLVGSPLQAYFTLCGLVAQSVDEETENIISITSKADILISGTGEKDLITYQWIQPGATVIDCASDIHQDSVEQVAGAVAPSKGGVGPLTVVWLLHNVVQAAENQEKQV